MTEEQKDFLIAKMLDAPSSLSDKELEAITNDDELMEIYEMSAAVSGASVSRPEIDVKKEWERFRPRLRRKPSLTRRMMRVAAVFLGIAVASGIIVKMTDKLLLSEHQPVIAMVEQPAEIVEDSVFTTATDQVTEEKDENSVPSPANHRAPDIHNRPLLAKAEISPASRLPESEEMDIDEYLRIQQASIDNDIAMLTAEVVLDEFAEIDRIYDFVGETDEAMISTIRKVTMQ